MSAGCVLSGPLLREDADQRKPSLREQFNGLRYVIRHGIPWRAEPKDLPPSAAVYQQAQRRLAAGCEAEPSAAIPNSRTLRSSCERGARTGYDGAKRKKGSKLHMAVNTLGHLLALHVTPGNADDRGEVELLAKAIQAATENSVSVAYVDQGYTGQRATEAAKAHGIELEVVKLPEAKKGFVLLPKRWIVERSFAWVMRAYSVAFI